MGTESVEREIEVEVRHKEGIHAKPAALLAQLASKFESDIRISYRNREVNAKSLIGLMTLAANRGLRLNIRAIGKDSEAAIMSVKEFLERESVE